MNKPNIWVDNVNGVFIFYQIDERNIRHIAIGDKTAGRLFMGVGFKARSPASLTELDSLDLSGRSYPVFIPGFRGKGKMIESEAIKRVNRYKKGMVERISRYMPDQERIIRETLSRIH